LYQSTYFFVRSLDKHNAIVETYHAIQHNNVPSSEAHYEEVVLGKKMFFFGVHFGTFQNYVFELSLSQY
jgi:hypothetical protein